MNKTALVALVAIIVSISACKGREAQKAAPQQPAAKPPASTEAAKPQPKPEPPKPVPQQIPPIVARVNDEEIPRTDFERAVKILEARAGGPVPAERRDEILRGVLDGLVTYRMLFQEAHRRSLDATEQEVQERVAQARQQFPTQQAFSDALKQRGMDPKQFERDARSDIAVGKLMQAEAATAQLVGENDAKEFYDKNPDRFKQPEAVRASHIFKRVAPGADAATKQKARAALEPVLKQVQSGGDFAALARKYSDDGSAQAGGDLNYFQHGQMVPEFEKVAFALKPGETSGIVESQYGFHIIRVTDHRSDRVMPFPDVKAQIADYLKQQRQQERTSALIEQLKAKSKIEILM